MSNGERDSQIYVRFDFVDVESAKSAQAQIAETIRAQDGVVSVQSRVDTGERIDVTSTLVAANLVIATGIITIDQSRRLIEALRKLKKEWRALNAEVETAEGGVPVESADEGTLRA